MLDFAVVMLFFWRSDVKNYPLTPTPPHHSYIRVLGCINLAWDWYKCIYKYPKTTLLGGVLRPLDVGPQNGLGYLWSNFQLTSWDNHFWQKNFSFLKIFVCLNKALYTSFQRFLGNCKCILTGITSNLSPKVSKIPQGYFLTYILGGIVSIKDFFLFTYVTLF